MCTWKEVLDRDWGNLYGAEPFEQQQFGPTGIEVVKSKVVEDPEHIGYLLV